MGLNNKNNILIFKFKYIFFLYILFYPWLPNKIVMKQTKMTLIQNNKTLKPIQMIKFDQKKNILLSQQAIDIFNKLETKQLCIVCVAGKYRTGKSYILNRVLLQQNHGFQVGPTINACTKGLWMWPEIVKINHCGHQKQCIVIDTEGLGSLEEGQNTDIKIFLMATLLSSYLIYNSVGSIDQKALESLNLVINMATLLQKNGDKFDSQQLINSFPSFMWLVRDFSLRLENENGQQITSQQYLQNALNTQQGKSLAAERKNQIRKQLKTFFQQRDCFTLIRPTLNQKDLQNLSTLSEKRLRPQFVDLIKQLKKRIHFGIQPKKIRGKSITPQGFIQLCNYYINNINSGKLPSINSQWDNICINESGRLIRKCQQKLKAFILANFRQDSQVDQQKFKQFYKNLLEQAFQTVQKSFLGKLQKKLTKQKLQKSMSQQLMELFEDKLKNEQKLLDQKFQNILISQYVKQCLNDNHISHQVQLQASQNSRNSTQKLKILLEKFQDFIYEAKKSNPISCLQEKDNRNSFNYKKYYDQLFTHVKQNILGNIEEQIFDLSQDLVQASQKYKRLEQKYNSGSQNQKNQLRSLRTQIQQKSLLINQLTIKNKLSSKAILQLKQTNFQLQQTLKKKQTQISQLSQKNSEQLIKKYQTKQQTFKAKIHKLQEKIDQLQQNEKQILQKIKQFTIKQRKIIRQSDIYKQKIIQLQRQNQSLNKLNESLKKQIQNIQKQNRNLIRKSSMKKLMTSSEIKLSKSFLGRGHLKTEPDQCSQSNDQQNSVDIEQQSKLQQLLNKTKLLEIKAKKYQQENTSLYKLLNQQHSINQVLINSSHSLNYQSLKKNYQIQKKINQKSSRKIKEYESLLGVVNRLECKLCRELVNKNVMMNGHYKKCVMSQEKELNFDVSYVYDSDGEIKFLFEIQMENKIDQNSDPLERLGLEEHKSNKWQITKSMKSIKAFLQKIGVKNNELNLFKQQKNSSLQYQNQRPDVKNQDNVNLNQQRRLFLDQTCHKLKSQIWKNNYILQFFGIDFHLIKLNKLKKCKEKCIQNQMDNKKLFKRKRKIGVLNLQLGQITQEVNQNDNYQKPHNKKRLCSQSVNLMKTTKFSQKKTFRFGPNI